MTASLLKHGARNRSTSLESALLSIAFSHPQAGHSPLTRTLPAVWPEMTAAWPWLLSRATQLYACALVWPQSLAFLQENSCGVGGTALCPRSPSAQSPACAGLMGGPVGSSVFLSPPWSSDLGALAPSQGSADASLAGSPASPRPRSAAPCAACPRRPDRAGAPRYCGTTRLSPSTRLAGGEHVTQRPPGHSLNLDVLLNPCFPRPSCASTLEVRCLSRIPFVNVGAAFF